MRAQNVGRRNGLGAGNLQVIEVHFAFFALRDGAGGSEQVGLLLDD